MREHTPASPRTIGESTGLVYCMACGYLLSSDAKGPTKRADETCIPVQVGLRNRSDIDEAERITAAEKLVNSYAPLIKDQLECSDHDDCACTFCEFIEDLRTVLAPVPAGVSGARIFRNALREITNDPELLRIADAGDSGGEGRG